MALDDDVETIFRGDIVNRSRTYDKYLIIPDTHAPYEDNDALHAIYRFAKDFNPTEVVLLGDHVDFYALSKFDKNPDRINSLQKEIDVLQYHLKELRKVHPSPKKITYLRGNHEFRLIKYLWRNPEIHSLRDVNSIERLLKLHKFDVDFKISMNLHGFLLKHGDIVRKYSSYTAKGEFDNEGTSGGSGHTHRMGCYYVTNRSGQHAWYEFGHLCNVEAAEYMEGKIPNWQKGFGTIIYNRREKVWDVEQYPIIDNKFIAMGKTYSWKKGKYSEREKLR